MRCASLMEAECNHFRILSVYTRLNKEDFPHRFNLCICFSAYHCKCVDPWLTQTKKTCPVCKQRVTRKNPEHSESESEEEAIGRGEEDGTGVEADSERTPLLRPSNPGSPSGSPGAYSATITTAQCLASPAHCDSPILGYEDYHSPQEDTESECDDADEERHHTDDDTAQLINRGRVGF